MRIKIVIFVVLIIVTFSLFSKLLVIEEVECVSQYGPCKAVIADELRNLEGLDYFNFKKTLPKVISPMVLVDEYSSRLKLWDKAIVSVIETKVPHALKVSGEDLYVLVDGSGRITEFTDNTNLPYIEVAERGGSVGELVDPDYKFALDVVSNMFYVYGIKYGKIENGSLVVELANGIKVIFPLAGDPELLISSLGLIISNLKVDNKEFRIDETGVVKEIDLRYKNPVLR